MYFHPLEDAEDEIELLGFPFTYSFFVLLENMRLPQIVAADLSKLIGQNVSIVESLVHEKRTKTTNVKYMSFVVFIPFQGYWMDTVESHY